MGKLISFVVFLAAFVWTWFLFQSEPKVNVGVHAGLQSKLAVMIEETIKANKPQAYGFQMLSIYTETIDANKVSAHFSYKYSERTEDKETSQQTIKGVAVLNRTASENPQDEKWVVQSVRSNNTNIEFQEGSIIGADTTTTTNPESATPASGDATTAVPTEESKSTQ